MIININNKLLSFGAPVGRLLMVAIFFISGISKITSYKSTPAWMDMKECWVLFTHRKTVRDFR